MKRTLVIAFFVLLSCSLNAQVELSVQKGHSAPISLLEFSPSTKYLASASSNGEIILWDVALGKSLSSFTLNYKEEALGMKFIDDEKQLQVRTKYNTVFFDIQKTVVTRNPTGDTLYREKGYYRNKSRDYETFIRDGAIKKKRIDKKRKKYKLAVTHLRAPFMAFDVNEDLNIIIGVAADERIYVYNYKNGNKKKVLEGHNSEILDVRFSPDGKYFATAGRDRSIIIWRTRDYKIEKRFFSNVYKKNTACFSQDGLRIYSGDELGYMYAIDLSTVFPKISVTQPNLQSVNKIKRAPGGLGYWVASSNNYLYYKENLSLKKAKKYQLRDRAGMRTKRRILQGTFDVFQEPFGEVQTFEISPNGKRVLFTGNSEIPNIAYAEIGKRKVHHVYNYFSDSLWAQWTSVGWVSDDKFVACLERSKNMYVFDVSSSKVKMRTDELPFEIENFVTLGDGKFWVNSKYMGQHIYDANSRTTKEVMKMSASNVFHHQNYVILATENHQLIFYDYQKNKVHQKYKGHSDHITDIDFHPNKKIFISSSEDGTVKLWNMEEERLIVTIIPFRTEEFVFVTDDNYYLITKGAMDEIGFMREGQFFFPEQFDLKYNRPDLVLKEMGFTDEELLAAYYKAYQKRLKKLNFTEEQLTAEFHLPETVIRNIGSLPAKTDQSSIDLQLEFKDTKYPLDRINLYVNGVAVKGKDGIDLRSENTKEYSGRFSIDLAYGENKIDVSVLNQSGQESYKKTAVIECTAGKQKPTLYLVTMGVSKYKDKDFNLEYAAKDAKDMAGLFVNNTFFSEVKSKTITDEQVTLESLDDLKNFVDQADINDVVMVFVAGHGVLDNNFDYFFASHDMDFSQPAKRGIPYERVEGLLDGIRALKKLLFLDTCHSGEVDKDDLEVDDEMPEEEQGDLDFRSAGLRVRYKQEALLDGGEDGAFGLKSINELMKSVFADLRKGTGATVISSSGGAELSIEGETYNNGLFTYCMLRGLNNRAADLNKDKTINVRELQVYVRDEVTKLSNGKQTPTSRISNDELDYRLW